MPGKERDEGNNALRDGIDAAWRRECGADGCLLIGGHRFVTFEVDQMVLLSRRHL